VWSSNGNSCHTNLTFSLVKDNAGCEKSNEAPTLLLPLLQHHCPLLVHMHRENFISEYSSLLQHHCENLKLATLPLLKVNNTFWCLCDCKIRNTYVFYAMLTKKAVLWPVTTYSLTNFCKLFWKICYLHLQGKDGNSRFPEIFGIHPTEYMASHLRWSQS
jgi:hypothetical protein